MDYEFPETARQRYLKRLNMLSVERSSWEAPWQELAQFISPRRGEFFMSDSNLGTKKHSSIINGTAEWALGKLSAAMVAGLTSPARPWFGLSTPDEQLAEYKPVRAWFNVVEDAVRSAMLRSKVYKALALGYVDLGMIGTTCIYLEEDPLLLVRPYVFPVGQFYLANNSMMRVDTLYRKLPMTVRQLVQKFGLDSVSPMVRSQYQLGTYDTKFNVCHVIEPNNEQSPGRGGAKGMAFKSSWFEIGGVAGVYANTGDFNPALGMLRESGYEEFPCCCPRWQLKGEDVYGSSPGMSAIGDVKGLQILEKKKALAVEMIVDPPMRGPSSMMNQRASLLPGARNYNDAAGPHQVFQPAVLVDPRAIEVALEAIREHEGRIKTAFLADLFVAFLASEQGGSPMTAREVAERHEEKMLVLGPVLEQLEDELLEPMIMRFFGALWRSGRLPPPPPELQGQDFKIEYTSIFAQAQKMVAASTNERLSSFVGAVAAIKPEVVDKVKWDKVVEEQATALGVKPDLIATDDEVQAIRDQRAQQQAQLQQAQAAMAAAQGAKTLSETDMAGDNALTRVVGNVAGAQAKAGR